VSGSELDPNAAPSEPDDPVDGSTSSRGERAAETAIAWAAGIGAAVVVALFFVTIAHLQPASDVGVVVVADPTIAPGAPLHARVLGVGLRGRATFAGALNGVVVNERGLVVVPRTGSLVVEGVVADVPVRVDFVLAPSYAPDAGFTVSPWSRALALPAQGAAVYPERGLVTGRGTSRVVLVDDEGVSVVEVRAGNDARLPDGRLLLVDRVPLQARLRSLRPAPGGSVVVDVAGVDDDDELAFELLIGGVVRLLHDGRGPGEHALPVPADARAGDLVVVRVATSPLPSAAGRTLVTRIGGPRHDDLLRVEPRLDRVAAGPGDRSDDDVVARALLARLVPAARQAPVVSPSLHAQVVGRTTLRDEVAMVWRGRMRLASAVLAGLVVLAALRAARRAPAVAAGAVLVVVALFVGLDVVVGAIAGTLGP
jgi:hypothetical protein